MSVYLIVEIEAFDPEAYAEYVERAPATVTRFGGRYLVRAGPVTLVTGHLLPEQIIILEFPSKDRLTAWLSSSEYMALAPIRERFARSRAIVVAGVQSLP